MYSCIEDFFCDNYPSFKCSQIDNVFCQEIPESNWDQNTIIVGGSRSGNKRNLMNSWYQRNLMNSWYHCKIRNPEYENNVEQSNESANEKTEQVSHPSHYAWLKDLCGVEPLDICRHLDFNTGNAIKYLLRKDKVDGNKTKTEKRIEDLRKAVFYIQNYWSMEQTDYTCKDCFFFKNGACNHPNEIRFTSEENPSCTDFEYKEIKVEL